MSHGNEVASSAIGVLQMDFECPISLVEFEWWS